MSGFLYRLYTKYTDTAFCTEMHENARFIKTSSRQCRKKWLNVLTHELCIPLGSWKLIFFIPKFIGCVVVTFLMTVFQFVVSLTETSITSHFSDFYLLQQLLHHADFSHNLLQHDVASI